MSKTPSPREAAGRREAPLPAERAFVVQLRVAAGAADPIVGRVEHVVSGAAAQFACAADLIAFISKVVAAPKRAP